MKVTPQEVRIEPDVQALKPSFSVSIRFFVESADRFRIFDSRAGVELRDGAINKKIGWLNWFPQDPQEENVTAKFFALNYSLLLDHYTLGCIEKLRDDRDVELLFTGFLLIGTQSRVVMPKELWQGGRLGDDYLQAKYIYNCERRNFAISSKVPRSTWADFIGKIGLEEVRLIEIRFPKQDKAQMLKEAYERLTQAARKYHMGDYKGTVTEVRETIEAVEKLKAMGETNILFEAIGPRKFEKLKDLLAKARDFCGMAGHETQIGIEIYRSDARLAIELVRSILDYINTELSYGVVT